MSGAKGTEQSWMWKGLACLERSPMQIIRTEAVKTSRFAHSGQLFFKDNNHLYIALTMYQALF